MDYQQSGTREPSSEQATAGHEKSKRRDSSSSSSTWSFVNDSNAHKRPVSLDRPQVTRHHTLARLSHTPTSTSIFGSPAIPEPRSFPNTTPSRAVLPVADSDRQSLPQPQISASKEQRHGADSGLTVDTRLLPRVEKEADDPTAPPSSMRGARRTESTTLTTLSRLFAVQTATSPENSRHSSYIAPNDQPVYVRSQHSDEVDPLPDHLYTRGLLSGRHSDITVYAFGHAYHLHRLILDRSPFFASAFSEPWLEANAEGMTVHPEDIDASITQPSFELALKRLYGACSLGEEDQHPEGMFATGCWLEMRDLIESSVESMLRQMSTDTLSSLIKLVTNNYYGRAGDKILASAKAMLCRDGSQMPLSCWDGIPGDVIREIVGGDGFFIDSEWDRWILAKKILDRRLRHQAIAGGLLEPNTRRKIKKVPQAANLMAVRFDTVYRKHGTEAGRGVPECLQQWITLYTHPDIEPLLVLLDEGIHYIHLDFEQLQFIRDARDCLGLPVLPEKVISNALWQQMELRQKVLNSSESELELGLRKLYKGDTTVNPSRDTTMSILTNPEHLQSKGKRKSVEAEDEHVDEMDSGSWDGNGKPRKFWIPSSDCNIVMGGSAEPIIATPSNLAAQMQESRLSATIQPEDVQWAADFATATAHPRPSIDGSSPEQHETSAVSYSHFPPFRFAAEFPNPRLLKVRKRFYSRTVFYAGSLWNIYIQRLRSSRSKQLGVYLHRAKERETEEVIAGTAGLAQGSVDERIGQLEREMIMRTERRDRGERRRTNVGSDGLDVDGAESSESTGVDDGTLLGIASDPLPCAQRRASTTRGTHPGDNHKTSQTDIYEASPRAQENLPSADACNSNEDAECSESEGPDAPFHSLHVPTLPPYVDARPTIRTYFKIYSPSRGGRMLSLYESAPDRFNFSQSWGWKSSTLMLDEGLLNDDIDDAKDDGETAIGGEGVGQRRTVKGRGDGKLRFMVVIGNI